jgi:hypothetical protein
MNKNKDSKTMRRIAREIELAQPHVGILHRAQTFKNRKREQSRNACRQKGRAAWA